MFPATKRDAAGISHSIGNIGACVDNLQTSSPTSADLPIPDVPQMTALITEASMQRINPNNSLSQAPGRRDILSCQKTDSLWTNRFADVSGMANGLRSRESNLFQKAFSGSCMCWHRLRNETRGDNSRDFLTKGKLVLDEVSIRECLEDDLDICKTDNCHLSRLTYFVIYFGSRKTITRT
ncbi:hypothetical protein GNI_101740 [Gregarina niphandrodes]|uniref:Uncharacterized protein n=1 Tax=Gregarina niphandrodes TaxID=110365 RepID=A0A023B4D9_GRENI|nr:hypothetical protein GNI_101740 [Gregarina niphandrodes]EZG56715.1 hypothetical protein GNI_101740 [Gregarina niphandrodes]|eukprot:XP_011131183.1 hypothetical protein GNI_101740 [Gregarina niphandrodes]